MRQALLTRPLNAASAMLIRGPLRRKFELKLLLTCCIFVHPAHGASNDVANPRKSPLERKETADDVRTQEEVVYQTWTSMYGLDPATPLPPPTLASLPENTPPLAPHLLDCSLGAAKGEAAKAEATEALGGNGEVPKWWGDGKGPEPPWVRGGDEDNLPLTCIAQADIWRHQHPVNCNETGVRFLRIAWSNPVLHGLGSQLRLATSALSLAMAHGRILVVAPASFTRADHDGCRGDVRGSLDCYFESLAKSECGVRAEELLALKSGVTFTYYDTTSGQSSIALASATPLVVYHTETKELYESKAAL